jgi:general secretion pathway protein A
MDYFSILNLTREPFSNSPDPEFFYQSRQHLDCLQKLELSLHLRRGLNVIIGDVGTGKTTLCRQLIRRFAQRKEMETHLILDPLFRDGSDFLAMVAKLLSGKRPAEGATDWQVKEFIKHSLFRKGVDQKKTTVLIIDEGQKIPVFCLELLREFLNYETNEYKLLQIVIFAQSEFESITRHHPNFVDRINLFHRLKPMSFRDSREMIRFRLERSSHPHQEHKLFTLPALLAIYRITGGYPRKIINLCHQCVLTMIIQNRSRVGYGLVRRCAARLFTAERRRWVPATAIALALAAGAAGAAWHLGLQRQPPSARVVVSPLLKPGATPAAAPAEAAAPAAAQAPAAGPPPAPALPSPAETAAAAPPKEAPAGPAAPEKPAAAEPAVSQPETPAPPSVLRPPEMLGSVRLNLNETVSGLIQKVYGGFSTRHFRAVILANPHIADPNRVEAGQTIHLPAVATPVQPLNKNAWWVKVGETDTVEKGIALLRGLPESAPAMRLIPVWRPSSGLRFVVVLKQVFTSAEAADLQRALLPTGFDRSGQVLTNWGEEAVLYGDPYWVK